MYLARFELGATALHVAAADLGVRPSAPLLPHAWRAGILEARACDIAVRFQVAGGAVRSRLLLSAEGDPGGLERLVARLAAANHPADGITLAGSKAEFDRLATDFPPHHLWLNPRGYLAGGRPVAADYRLLPILDRLAAILGPDHTGFTYQINLRRHVPPEGELRAVRRHLAALAVESPFPAPLTALQAAITARLQHPAVLSEEILAVGDRPSLEAAVAAITEDFAATMGPLGFRHPPLEPGQFDDLLLTARQSTSFGEPGDFLSRSAGALAVGEVERLLGAPPPALIPDAEAPAHPAASPAVFLSYSSKDYLAAMATCRHLEAAGVGCWMAPRNIRPGEAYPEAIMRGIEGCMAMVVLLSDSSNLSPHVHREIERALSRNAVIIPLRLLEIMPSGAMAYLLSTCQWIDAYGPATDSALTLLLERLRGLVARAGG